MVATILIVDDQQSDRLLLEEVLKAQGFLTATAGDGQHALDEFPRVQPDLVLLDAMMPKLNGYEVCRQLKKNPKTCLTPVVLVTSHVETQDRVRGLEVGGYSFRILTPEPHELPYLESCPVDVTPTTRQLYAFLGQFPSAWLETGAVQQIGGIR